MTRSSRRRVIMNWRSESTVKMFASISSRIFISFIVLFCLSGTIGALSIFYEIKWKWLEVFNALLYIISELLLVVSWVTPGILIVLRVPWLAHAWLRGINPIAVPSTPWEQLSSGRKASIYFYAIGISALTLFAIVGFILYTTRV